MKKTLTALLAGVTLAATMTTAALSKELRLSHQWSTNDIRHKVAQIVADEVAAANVDLEIKIFPSGSLFKAREQYKPLSAGQLDMTVYPLSYAGGQRPEYNLTLMPGLVKNHDHAARLNKSEFMQEIEKLMAEDDVRVVVHGYLAGGFASKDNCITKPEDVKGLQTRAAGKAFEEMLAAAGASIASMASSEVYSAMQSGVLNAVNTSSSSFVSSTRTTVSAPSGMRAPVMIRDAVPPATTLRGTMPAAMVSSTVSRAGCSAVAPATSVARTAYPSIAAFGKEGTLREA